MVTDGLKAIVGYIHIYIFILKVDHMLLGKIAIFDP